MHDQWSFGRTGRAIGGYREAVSLAASLRDDIASPARGLAGGRFRVDMAAVSYCPGSDAVAIG